MYRRADRLGLQLQSALVCRGRCHRERLFRGHHQQTTEHCTCFLIRRDEAVEQDRLSCRRHRQQQSILVARADRLPIGFQDHPYRCGQTNLLRLCKA